MIVLRAGSSGCNQMAGSSAASPLFGTGSVSIVAPTSPGAPDGRVLAGAGVWVGATDGTNVGERNGGTLGLACPVAATSVGVAGTLAVADARAVVGAETAVVALGVGVVAPPPHATRSM